MLIFRAPVLLPAARLFPLVPALATAGRRPSLLRHSGGSSRQ